MPQRRSRLFLIGSKNGIQIELGGAQPLPLVTVGNAFCDLPVLENGAGIDCLQYSGDSDSDYAKLMRNALTQCSGNLVSRNAKYILERYTHIHQGQNWAAIPPELLGFSSRLEMLFLLFWKNMFFRRSLKKYR